MKDSGIMWPVILIGIGFFALLNNFVFEVPVRELIRDFWPFIPIVVGLVQVLRAINSPGSSAGVLMGGMITTTVGVLFAFHTLLDVSFGRTWPVLLIVIGVLGVLRFAGTGALAGGRWNRGGFRR